MKVWTGLRNTVKKRKWPVVEVPMSHLRKLRSVPEYLEWFANHQSVGRYAIFSVPNGNEYWFENPEDATLFALKWS